MSTCLNLFDTVMLQAHDNDIIFIEAKFSCPKELERCIDKIF